VGVIVNFNFVSWAELFPEFVTNNPPFVALTETQVVGVIYPVAIVYCRNDGGGPVTDTNAQLQLLNLMVAHLCQLFYGSALQQVSPLVGQINSATEGSVHVSSQMPTTPNAAWFYQTKYGAAYWQMIAPYRTMRYRPKITPQVQLTGWPWRGS
jgi:Protein of unknown function (DUF4054)